MATSGQVNTNSITTVYGNTYYVETKWEVNTWNSNTATISWSAILRRSAGSNSKVNSWGLSGNVNGHSWSIASGTQMSKDQTLGSGTFTLGGGSTVTCYCSGAIYGKAYTVNANQSWTLSNNIIAPSCSCTITGISENSISASLTVTNNGNASITENVLQIYTDSGYTTKAKSDINGTSGTWTGLSLHTTYYIRARVKNSLHYSSYAKTSGQTWDKPTISNVVVKNLIAGNSQTVTLNNSHNRNCTIKVIKVDGGTVLYTGSTTGTSLTFTIPADKCRLALGSGSSENKTPVNLTYTCSYSSWSTPYNTSPSCTLGINTTYKPTWNSNFNINAAVTYRDTNSTSRNITGDPQILVQGKSEWAYTLKLTGNQAAIKNSNSESDIKKYQVSTYNGTTWTGFTDIEATATNVSMGKVDSKATSVGIRIQAVDCKGVISDIKTKTISVTPYAIPTGTLTAKRQNNYGTTVELTINPTWAVGSGNAGTAAWSYKLSTASSWTTGGTISTFNTPVALGISFDNDLSYEFKIVLTDAFGGSSTAILASVGPGTPIFFIDETVNGVGVNTIPTKQGAFVDGIIKGYDGADIDGDVYLNDDTYIGNNLDVTGTTSTNTLTVVSNATINGNSTTKGTMTGKLINDYSGYVTSGTSGLSSYWFKVWDATFATVQYDDKCYTLQINGGYNTYWGQICFRVRQNRANGGGAYNLTCQLYRLSGSIPLSNMRLYYNNSTGACSLWVNCTGRYNTFNYQIISKTGRTTKEQAPYGTFYSGSYSSAQTLPSDSYITMTDITVLSSIYPVGSIYLSAYATSPASLFGGTWTQLQSRYLYATGVTSGNQGKDNVSTYTGVRAQGTAITIDQMPSHNHGGATYFGNDDRTHNFNWLTTSSGSNLAYNTIQYQGGGQAHTHNISYIALYVWQRTA